MLRQGLLSCKSRRSPWRRPGSVRSRQAHIQIRIAATLRRRPVSGCHGATRATPACPDRLPRLGASLCSPQSARPGPVVSYLFFVLATQDELEMNPIAQRLFTPTPTDHRPSPPAPASTCSAAQRAASASAMALVRADPLAHAPSPVVSGKQAWLMQSTGRSVCGVCGVCACVCVRDGCSCLLPSRLRCQFSIRVSWQFLAPSAALPSPPSV